ncbi:MAG: LysR family transcriptional regulator [Clostridiales Family XIII bacterium]|nr:LysR family transcriptional regulator [Clostridiales Family XIII bacterium]
MPKITLQQIEYAIAVSEAGSIGQAAKALFISPSGLSATIKELEQALGFSVFDRSHSGVMITEEGAEFCREAEQLLKQTELLENKFSGRTETQRRFSVSAQHYSFASAAFARLARKYRGENYKFRLMETKTREVLSDVKHLVSEIGLLYTSDDNAIYIDQFLKEDDLVFHELFETHPYVLVGDENPLRKMPSVSLKDLEAYPCIIFGQEHLDPLYFSEEILSALQRKESLIISDRGALADLLDHTDAYLISSGLYMTACKSDTTVAVPLDVDKVIRIGIVRRKDTVETPVCADFRALLLRTISDHSKLEYTI